MAKGTKELTKEQVQAYYKALAEGNKQILKSKKKTVKKKG